MATYYSDLHCHTTLFAFNRNYTDPWYEEYSALFPAQGDFSQLARGNVRVVMVSLYPIEQGFVDLKPDLLGRGDITDFLTQLLIKIPKKRSDKIQSYGHDYYDDLLEEIDLLRKSADPVSKKILVGFAKRKRFSYRIAHDFNDLKAMLDLDDNLDPGPGAENTIAVVLTVEGAHSLGVGQRNTDNLSEAALRQKLSDNIAKLKKLGPPGKPGAWCPFFITLNHHFWNQLGGHNVSLYKKNNKLMDQVRGVNAKITGAGEFTVGKLLDNTGGSRRVLIDVAHMSMEVRRWYYKYLADRGDNLPVFFSHTGVNGKATIKEAEIHGDPRKVHEIADELYDHSDEFNPWDLLVSDEEIMLVHNSGGMIGLNLDHRIMMGKKRLEETKKQARRMPDNLQNALWARPLINEILHIAGHILAKTGKPEKIWDNIGIGSDFNGMISPAKEFRNAARFPDLDQTLFSEMKKLAGAEKTLSGKSETDIREIVDKIMWKNNLRFLEKHFHF
jgi:microsomal dipeptidase-like Zn-dependent dipeptidase